MGNHLYDENRRLKAENEELRRALNQPKEVKDHDMVVEGITAFFAGTARIVVEPQGDGHSIRFQV